MPELLSWSADRDNQILPRLIALHAPPHSPLKICDVTSNRGYMWQGTGYTPLRCDIDPDQHPDIVADCRALPFAAGSFDVIVFDPPHVPRNTMHTLERGSSSEFARNYGIGTLPANDTHGVSKLFAPFLAEAARVLCRGGIVLAKLADGVMWGYQWHHVDFIQAARQAPGLTPCDQHVKVRMSPGTPQPSNHPLQHHCRAAHSYWIVVRKGNCDGPGLARPVSPMTLPMFDEDVA